MNKKITLAIIATTPLTLKFFFSLIISKLHKKYNIVILTNTSKHPNLLIDFPKNVKIINIKIKREISFFSDIYSFLEILNYLRKENVSIVYSITPKGGFLGIVAAKILNIPVRIHNYTGQVWVTKKGIFRYILKKLDKLIYLLSTKVLVDSNSQRDFLIKSRVIGKSKSNVIGNGSISGVNIKLFSPNTRIRSEIRNLLGIKKNTIVFAFIGRLNIDKGIIDLIKAYSKVTSKVNNTYLLVIGPNEMAHKNLKQFANSDSRNLIKILPFTSSPERYLPAIDICCLPSHREGFGSVIIEAGSCEVPSIGTNIYGLKDSIEDGKTGFLVKVKNIDDLAKNMILLAKNNDLRKKMGKAARKRVMERFDQRVVLKKLLNFIDKEASK